MGVTIDQFKGALNRTLCGAEPLCNIMSSSRRALHGPTATRRELQSTATFIVTRTLDASSSASLAAPTVNAAAVAADLNVQAAAISTTSTVQSVEASVAVVSLGSATSTQAQNALATQAAIPMTLASSLGFSASDFTFTATPTVIGPPRPPPTPPPPPFVSPSSPSAEADLPALVSPPFPPTVIVNLTEEASALDVDQEGTNKPTSSSTSTMVIAAIAAVAAVALLGVSIYLVRRRRALTAKQSIATTVQAQVAGITKHDDLEVASASASAFTVEMPDSESTPVEMPTKFEDLKVASTSASDVTVEMPAQDEEPADLNAPQSSDEYGAGAIGRETEPLQKSPPSATNRARQSKSTLSSDHSDESASVVITFEAGPLGIDFADHDGLIKVTSIGVGSAAESQGLRVGAIVCEVDGKSTDGLDKAAVLTLIEDASRPLKVKLKMHGTDGGSSHNEAQMAWLRSNMIVPSAEDETEEDYDLERTVSLASPGPVAGDL